MQKWTVDADDVRDIGEDLFHETPWISDFLAPDNTSRLFLVGTKGFGKTLLLLAKRLRFERARSAFHLLPENELVDKPVGQVRIFSRPDIDKITQDDRYWEHVWLMAIVLAIHKASCCLSNNFGSCPLLVIVGRGILYTTHVHHVGEDTHCPHVR